MVPDQAVRILYANHRGEVATCTIVPESITHGVSEWHPAPQWLLWAYDLDKRAVRTFAMSAIQKWEPIARR